jgi:monoamine oxidase
VQLARPSKEELAARNERMTAKMKAAVGGDLARFQQARMVSVDFIKNKLLTAAQFVKRLTEIFGGVRNMQSFFDDMVALMPDPNGTVRSELQLCYSQMLQAEAAMPQQPLHGAMPPAGQFSGLRSENTGGTVGVGAPGLLPGQDPLDQLRAFMGQQQRQAAPPAQGSALQAAQQAQAQRAQMLQQPVPQLPAIYDAVVVGAGAAGIAVATSLRDNGLTVLVLEARDRVGGRVHSQACAGLSSPVDLGSDILYGARDQKHLLSRAQLLHERFRSVHLLENTVIFDEEENKLSGNSQHAALMKHTANQNAELHTSLVQYSSQPQLGDMAVEEALESKYKECCSGWGPSMGGLRQRVLDWRLQAWHLADYRLRAKKEGLSARRWMSSDDSPNNDISFTGGFGNVMQRLAEPLDIRLSTIVEHVKYEGKPSAAQLLRSGGSNGPASDKEPLVKVRCRGGAEYTGRFCVITVPLGVLKAGRIAFSPPLPPRKTEAMSRLGTGAVNKVVLHFRTAFWQQTVGQSHIGIVSTNADQHAWYCNASAATNAPVLIAVLHGNAARFAEVSSDAQVVARAVRSLQLAFRPVHVPEPTASHVTRWGSDPFAQGGYSFFAAGSSAADCEAMAEPCGWRKHHLGFAGEATTAANMGTVLGAWCSGEAEAARVLKEMETPMRSADGSSGVGAGDLVRQGSSGAAPVSLPRANSGSDLPAGLEPIDEKERREREQFIGRGPGAKPEGATSGCIRRISRASAAHRGKPFGQWLAH